MIYFLKFCASLILPPGIFIVLFFFLAYCCLKNAQVRLARTIFILTLGLYICSTNLFAGYLMGKLERDYTPPLYPAGDVIVMLGGGATRDTPDVSGMGGLCSIPSSRLLTAVRLQRKLHVPIIVSGGAAHAASAKEALIARRILIDLGVPEDKIIVEDKSLNTKQNALFCAKIIKERDFSEPLLVTSAFHMRRAVLNFKQQGINVIAYPTDYTQNIHRSFYLSQLMPSGEALFYTETALQENLRYLITKYLKY